VLGGGGGSVGGDGGGGGGAFVVVVCVPAQKETGDDERMDAIFNLGAYHRRTM